MKQIIYACLIFALSGCATMSAEQIAKLKNDANQPVNCVKGEDCEVKWGKVVTWIQANSHWKLRIATDSMITTEGPFNEVYAAYQVSKVPTGQGNYDIIWQATCGNAFGCVPSLLEQQAHFVNFVMGKIK